jgi:short-subunit dehydrogenase
VTIGSGLRVLPAPGMNLYSSTKKFVAHLFQIMSKENTNIDFLCFEPGPVKTNMTKDVDQGKQMTPR